MSFLKNFLSLGFGKAEPRSKAVLALSDGTVIHASGFGAEARRVGELVFTTNMTGYEECLTDPSYAGQILTMTYPLIGNYGTQPEWTESGKVQVEGFAVRKMCNDAHHVKSGKDLHKRLEDAGVPGIRELDTRSLVRQIRTRGVMPAAIEAYEKSADVQGLIEAAKRLDYSKINFVEKVSCGKAASFGKGSKKVVLIDYGVKMGIVREMNKRGAEVVVVPWNAGAEEILSFSPKGIIACNGPGDPAVLMAQTETLKKLFHLPIFGICLGNQLLAQSGGAKCFKLPFGHRGGNHPVLDMRQNKVIITTQNHGFAVEGKGLGKEWQVTHRNLTDGTVEGIAHRELPIFAVQYHPEANPGPCDSKYLFDRFVAMI